MVPLDEALFEAVKHGDARKAEALLKQGADVKAQDKEDGRTPLHWAAANGYKAVMEVLVIKGAMVDAIDEEMRTPLHWAAYNGHLPVVERLLAGGASVNAVAKNGWMPLNAAVARGNAAIVEVLLAHGATVNAIDKKFGMTLLHKAVMEGQDAVVHQLIMAGAEVNITDRDGKTPLHWAATTARLIIIDRPSRSGRWTRFPDIRDVS
ncbi:MAG: ankyrin repeat domain-containing protein [Nitrospira sp.]|nr:ankyrin repeat domain-containing protein [Nitrospira sp.]